MQALRLNGIGQLRLEDVPAPRPGPGEVLVQVQAVGVCGSDLPRAFHKGAHVMPITLGHEFSGTVVELGSGVEGWRPGARVVVVPLIPCRECEWCQAGQFSLCTRYDYFGSRRNGAMAQYVNVPTGSLLPVPDSVPLAAAALSDPASIALHALLKAGERPAGPGVVYGVGAIGLLAVQIMRLMGMEHVYAVDVDDAKLELARQLGATAGVNSLTADPVEAIREWTGGRLGGTVLETAGVPSVQNQAVLSTAKLGTCLWVGITHRELILSAAAVDAVLRREMRVTGCWNSFSAPFPGEEWRQVLRWMESAGLRAEPVISHRFPVAEAADALQRMERREFVYNKVLIIPPGSEVAM